MKTLLRLTCFFLAASCGTALAGPGAHGPNGEHLDSVSPVLSAGASVPRLEARTELFELVARIEGGVFSILVDRYDTNEPVLDGAVEVEVGALKRKAAFRREQGDFAVTDAAFVQALSAPGTHAVVFTVAAGKDSDLLEGSMRVAKPADDDHGHGYSIFARPVAWGGAIVLVAVTLAFLAWRRRRVLR